MLVKGKTLKEANTNTVNNDSKTFLRGKTKFQFLFFFTLDKYNMVSVFLFATPVTLIKFELHKFLDFMTDVVL
jgi:hypothetical protein